jgi:XTP/dITP diphosphohydrolase
VLDVVIASRNRHKCRELARLLRGPGARYRSLATVPHARAVAERGRTYAANAAAKARAAARASGGLAVGDDSGIEVDALGGAPGVRSARFAGRQGSDAANNRKLLRLLRGVPPARRGARYRCVLALASPARVLAVVEGEWRGRIAQRPAGRGGFGYDPLFLVPAYGRTVGQLPAKVKARLSHRAAAARRLRPHLALLARPIGPRGNPAGPGVPRPRRARAVPRFPARCIRTGSSAP